MITKEPAISDGLQVNARDKSSFEYNAIMNYKYTCPHCERGFAVVEGSKGRREVDRGAIPAHAQPPADGGRDERGDCCAEGGRITGRGVPRSALGAAECEGFRVQPLIAKCTPASLTSRMRERRIDCYGMQFGTRREACGPSLPRPARIVLGRNTRAPQIGRNHLPR